MKERTALEHEIAALRSAPPDLREVLPWDPSAEVEQALKAKHWARALDVAIEAGQRDENALTNLVFFAQNPGLPRGPLDPKAKDFAKQRDQWNLILKEEVRPARQRASTDYELEVQGSLVAERDPEFVGARGKQFRELVEWAAELADLNPGFLAAVLLAERDKASDYLNPGEISSFFTGADDFLAKSARMAANVPAFSQVHFDRNRRLVDTNEAGRQVTTILFRSGKDAALATAVYLKDGEIKLRKGAAANGGDFDAFPVPVRLALTRIAMAAGHGGIENDGHLGWCKRVGRKWLPSKAGTPGAQRVGVAARLEQVLKGEDIFVRGWEPRKFPDTAQITARNATILTAQSLHLSDWVFGRPLVPKPKRPVRPW